VSLQDQALVDHLAELRKRLIWTLVFFIVCLCFTFYFVNEIYDWLVSDATRLFPELGPIKLTVLGPGEILKVYLTVAGLAAVGLTLPFLLYQVWGFIKPALSEREARLAFRFLPLVLGMFLLGICFGYFFIFPMLFKFLVKIGQGRFQEMFTASSYFSFMTNMVLPFGLIFEMPVAVMFLTRIGIIAPQTLTKIRKYAYLAIIVIASMISPPDFVSHLSVAAPMVLLYEISILISRWMFKIRQKALLDAEIRFAEESEM
jgi:sec-independent protein translocase protein TatC